MDKLRGINEVTSGSDSTTTGPAPQVGNAASDRATRGATGSFDAQKTMEDQLCLSHEEEPTGVGGFLKTLKDGLFGSPEDAKQQQCLEDRAKNQAEIQRMMQEDNLRSQKEAQEILFNMHNRPPVQ